MANETDDLVPVFHASDAEVLPLAEGALEEQGIDYTVRRGPSRVPFGFGQGAEFGGAENAADILVRPEDAARARDVLADLQRAGTAPTGTPPPAAAVTPGHGPGTPERRDYRLMDMDTGVAVGDISQRQLEFLRQELEEESSDDRDYYIDSATIDMLAAAGADQGLIDLLQHALAGRDGMDVSWAEITPVR